MEACFFLAPLPACVYYLYLDQGKFCSFLPYPFLDVDQLGYQPVLINCIWVSFAFLVFSLLFIATGKGISKKKIKNE